MAPLIPLFNKYKNYVYSAYMFYLNGWVLFTIFGLKMGIDSMSFLLFFPVILSLVQMFARKELLKHLFLNFIICFSFIILMLYGQEQHWLYVHPTKDVVNTLKYIVVFFTFTVTLSFLIVLTFESARQEKQINSILKEKEVLLAEVFHRVKNNMNIVTSLLNLKKNASDSEVVKQALEECKNRVYSMALVHHNIYKTNNFTELDMKEYIHDLVDELLDSHGNTLDTETVVKCTDISLDLAKAVPFGLILNELITNSFKYARTPDKKLRIEIHVVKVNNDVSLLYRDNGPGMKEVAPKKNALGVELIKSLSEQVDGVFGFEKNAGLVFNLKFSSN
jgi:two-component sensor histidine kinase